MMVVLILENAPARLKGRLTLWMMEVTSSTYVADINSRLRDWIWNTVIDNIDDGYAIQIWSTSRSTFGYDMRSVGTSNREIGTIDGIKTIMIGGELDHL